MRNRGICRFLSGAILFGLALALVLVPQQAAWESQSANPPQPTDDESVPAYHAQAPQGDLPTTMDPALFTEPIVQNAYTVAAKIKNTLYQQPCYCHCDRSHGHTSLLDCFASKHGSGGVTRIYEDFYAFEQSRKGKTAEQIRAGVIKGEWKSIDAAKYQKLVPAQ